MPCALQAPDRDENGEEEEDVEGLGRADAEYGDRFVMDSLEAMGSRSAELAMEVRFALHHWCRPLCRKPLKPGSMCSRSAELAIKVHLAFMVVNFTPQRFVPPHWGY